MEVWLTMAVTQVRHSFGQKCGQCPLRAKGGRGLKGSGSEAGGILKKGMRALGQTTRWIWEPELPGVGWKELGKKEQTRFTFFCVYPAFRE